MRAEGIRTNQTRESKMGTERINFWKLANDYNYAHGVTPKPEVEPAEYPLPLPSFSVGDRVKLTEKVESDSGKIRKRRTGGYPVGDRLITDADRAEYARACWATFNSPLNRMTRAETEHSIRMMFPIHTVDVHTAEVLEVVTPDCTHIGTYSPTWSSCEVRNPRTGEQFIVHRAELQLA